MKFTRSVFKCIRPRLLSLVAILIASLTLAPSPTRQRAQASGDSARTIRADNTVSPSDTTVTEYPIPTPNSGSSNITVGPDGNFWFTETSANKIGHVTTRGFFMEFPLPTTNSQPF